jgi:hypothetical protein
MKNIVVLISIILLSGTLISPVLSKGKPREGLPGRRVGSGTRLQELVNTDYAANSKCRCKYCCTA